MEGKVERDLPTASTPLGVGAEGTSSPQVKLVPSQGCPPPPTLSRRLKVCPHYAMAATTLMTVKSKGKGWVDATTGKQLWVYESKGMFKCHSLVKDPESGKVLATIITAKSGINTITNYVCKDTSSYPSQKAIPAENSKKVGIKMAEGSTALYRFSKIDTKHQLSAATSEYRVVTGPDNDDQMKIVYKAEKLAALGFLTIFTDVSGGEGKEIIVGKAVNTA